MYSEKLEKLVAAALEDGILTSEEKELLFNEAAAEGLDIGEFKKFLDANLFIRKKSLDTTNTKYSNSILKMIDRALADNILTDSEKSMLFEDATEAGIDVGEFEQYLNAMLVIKQFANDEKSKLQANSPIPADDADLEELDVTAFNTALDAVYESAIKGIPKFDSAEQIAQSYLKTKDSLAAKANSLIRYENSKTAVYMAVSEFDIALLLGEMALALPSEFAMNTFIKMRMIAAIAYIAGYDLKDEKVRTLVYSCATGEDALSILKSVGIDTDKGIKSMFDDAKSSVGKAVDIFNNVNELSSGKLYSVFTKKFGKKFAKIVKIGGKFKKVGNAIPVPVVPLAFGLINGTMEAVRNNSIGNAARDVFIGGDSNDGVLLSIAGESVSVAGRAVSGTASVVSNTVASTANDVSKAVSGAFGSIFGKSKINKNKLT
ncbi:MAG: hypothetical protein LBO69_01445 [Ignavibacteria bacterium]|jgi:hypothetical protein|nr:hypothetical protein [Ignavibacteria bacterium]